LDLAGPESHLGWVLQSQTNVLDVGVVADATAWFDWPGTTSVTSTTVNLSGVSPATFFRLRHP
jgi:hypothetical protein